MELYVGVKSVEITRNTERSDLLDRLDLEMRKRGDKQD